MGPAAEVWDHPLVRCVRPHLDGQVVWVVGGVVRDALIGRDDDTDLDLVVKDDAIGWARRMAPRIGARLTAHGRFGTAELVLDGGATIDVASARQERYAYPGALPEVEPASLTEDLARRDFTVNAMAVALNGSQAGGLVDPHGGADDLQAGRLRPLRTGSFVEDPSRVVRAARYAGRLGLGLVDAAAAEIRAAASTLDAASARVADELQRALDEPAAGAALEHLVGWGTGWVYPGPAARVGAIDAAADHPHAPPLERWPLRAGAALDGAAIAASALPGWARTLAGQVQQGPALLEPLAAAARASERDRVLRAAPPAATVGALAAGGDRVVEWWLRGRDVSVTITGSRLVALGVPPGPAIGRALERVRAALLDGEVSSDEQQLRLALAEARKGVS